MMPTVCCAQSDAADDHGRPAGHERASPLPRALTGLLKSLCHRVSALWGRRGRRDPPSGSGLQNIVTVVGDNTFSVASLATPNHVPFHGAYPEEFKILNGRSSHGELAASGTLPAAGTKAKSPIGWKEFFLKSRKELATTGELQLAPIAVSNGQVSHKLPPPSSVVSSGTGVLAPASVPAAAAAAGTQPWVKPADLWKHDQALMLQDRYSLDAAFAQKYRLKQLLGEGSFGFVWVAERRRDHREVAVKFILRDKVPTNNWIFDAELGLVPLEVHIMRQIVHRNIIQFLDYFADPRFIYLVTEIHGTSWTWPNPRINPIRNPGLRPPGQLLQLSHSNAKDTAGVPGVTRRSPCDLFECIEAHTQLPDVVIRRIFAQIYDAVCYLYSLGIVHRDLKDENVVVDESYHIKLIDFGSASFVPKLGRFRPEAGPLEEAVGRQEGYFDRFHGTLAFAAPEVIRGLRYRPSDAEVWSMGILLYTMIFKKSPFSSAEAILHTHLDLPHEDLPGAYDLLRKMLQKNPLKRIRLEEIIRHPYMMAGAGSDLRGFGTGHGGGGEAAPIS